MQLIQNEKIFNFALIHVVGLLNFVSFCVDGMRSVLNDTYFVLCYDR